MAAHSLTIARELISRHNKLGENPTQAQQDAFIKVCEMALGAPGFDLGACDPGEGYHDLFQGIRQLDIPRIRRGLDQIVKDVAYLDGYSCSEDAKDAYEEFVRVGTPYWQKRAARWRRGEAAAHAKARPGSAPKFEGVA